MRGKQCHPSLHSLIPRITPARAGKTFLVLPISGCRRDHPRACGENPEKATPCSCRRGSPPRVRGKLRPSRSCKHSLRITPARAGKTLPSTPSSAAASDHPRACGENLRALVSMCSRMGSPPRVRGKLHGRQRRGQGWGITPARAGKTSRLYDGAKTRRDHPRACGENYRTGEGISRAEGSPPRVRGKPHERLRHDRPGGITPARAGKTRM